MIKAGDVWTVKEVVAARQGQKGYQMEFALVSPAKTEGTLRLEAGAVQANGEASWSGTRWLLRSSFGWPAVAVTDADGRKVATYREFLKGRLRTVSGEVNRFVAQDFYMVDRLWSDAAGEPLMRVSAMEMERGAPLEGRIEFVSAGSRREQTMLLAFVGWYVVGNMKWCLLYEEANLG